MKESRESGQSIVIIAFIILVILALLALVVDIGNAYAQRRVVQNAVDAAAMGCASKLAQQGPLVDCSWGPCRQDPVTDDQIEDIMRDYAELNGMERTEAAGVYVDSAGNTLATIGSLEGSVVPYNAMGVRVNGDLTFATYFAHLLGIDEITVNAPSAAYVLTGPCSEENLFPIALSAGNFDDTGGNPQIGRTYTMWDKYEDTYNGAFGWVHWGHIGSSTPPYDPPKDQGPNSSTLNYNMGFTQRSGTWRVGNYVLSSNGVMFDSKAREQLEARILGTPLDPPFSPTLPPTVTIPIYDLYDPKCTPDDDPESCYGAYNNSKAFRILGFAAFRLTCYHHSDNEEVELVPGACDACDTEPSAKCVRGYFVRWVEPPFDDGCLDTGLTAPSYRMPTQP